MDRSLSEQSHSVKQVCVKTVTHTCTHTHKCAYCTQHTCSRSACTLSFESLRITKVSLIWGSYYAYVHLHSSSSLGPIIGLATCLGLFFAIIIAMSTALLVLCVFSFKKSRNEKGKYVYICTYVHLRNVVCSLLHFGPLQNPTMLTQTMTFP